MAQAKVVTEEQRIINIGKSVDRIEKGLERTNATLTEHIRESEAVRAKVEQHERILVGGDMAKMVDDIRDVRERVIKIEERTLSRGGVWKDALTALTIISLVLGIASTFFALSRLVGLS